MLFYLFRLIPFLFQELGLFDFGGFSVFDWICACFGGNLGFCNVGIAHLVSSLNFSQLPQLSLLMCSCLIEDHDLIFVAIVLGV
ncbi:hypothetical protein Syun_026972 [Stephania yunnanensis]|uniref:Uncharacterized protein n=1 Tax=Stephania yunnanensis TaxID=152371 RepID=A0AAP0EES5_9MAGN